MLEKCRVQKLALTKDTGAIAGVKDEERKSEALLEISLERPLSQLSCRVKFHVESSQ